MCIYLRTSVDTLVARLADEAAGGDKQHQKTDGNKNGHIIIFQVIHGEIPGKAQKLLAGQQKIGD